MDVNNRAGNGMCCLWVCMLDVQTSSAPIVLYHASRTIRRLDGALQKPVTYQQRNRTFLP